MKYFLTLILCILFCTGTAYGQTGGIGLFVDLNGLISCFEDPTPGAFSIYAIHVLTTGAKASQWMLTSNSNMDCVYTGEVVHVPVWIGTVHGGISLAYGDCRQQVLLVTVNYYCLGTAPDCACIDAVPDPAVPSGTIEIVDCFDVKQIGFGGRFCTNYNGSCSFCWRPTKHSTWGEVKACYR